MGAYSRGLGPHDLSLIPLPLRAAQKEVITLFPNRKPHQKRIMFLHKPVKKRAAKWTAALSGASLITSKAQKHTDLKCLCDTQLETPSGVMWKSGIELSGAEVLTLSVASPHL